MSLTDKTILITGSARRVGRSMAIAIAQAGADVIIHHSSSDESADETRSEIRKLGRQAHIIKADLSDYQQTSMLIERAWSIGSVYAIVNNASIFEKLDITNTTIEAWNRHIDINLTAPFLICQSFAEKMRTGHEGRIVNILDWRALRPGKDHLPYTISKAALVALTKSLAVALSPNIIVNGLAFGAILPPSDGSNSDGILSDVPSGRWAELQEVNSSLIFLLDGPKYITGEIIHLDGGRHLV
jgi:NAD(P)-dependent dehydrogenase (short-subunit alcohol dehydrogenase family)